ncbi:MAG: hypothetical protein D3904_14905, partial [Candidatus Electrothrix sp. EH2]|nr:hypothetical protein [Candidatus Electrothrix sp. EH2]
IEQIGFSSIYEPLSKDSNLIAQTAISLALTGQSTIVLSFSAAYLALISPLSFYITVFFITGAIFVYLMYHQEISKELDGASEQEILFFSTFEHITKGFKEIRMNCRKNDAVFRHLQQISRNK